METKPVKAGTIMEEVLLHLQDGKPFCMEDARDLSLRNMTAMFDALRKRGYRIDTVTIRCNDSVFRTYYYLSQHVRAMVNHLYST